MARKLNKKKVIAWLGGLWGAFLMALLVFSFSVAPPASRTGGFGEPTCAAGGCHTSFPLNPPGFGSVTVTAPEFYTSGGTFPISVTVNDSDPSRRRWGFEVSVRTLNGQQAGNLSPSDSNSQLLSSSNNIQYLGHTALGTRSGTTQGVSFDFQWQAPNVSAGEVIFHAAGDASDGNFSPSGDRIYTTSVTVQPQQVSSTPPDVFDSGVVNNASFAPGTNPIPAGTIAAIFGTDLNDGSQNANSAFDSNGKLLTTLGGASVTFNGVAAPMFSSFPGQLNVQIPEEVAGSSSASVVVTVNGQASAARTVPIGANLPGIFTIPPGGTGQGAVQVANTVIFAAPSSSIAGQQARPANRGEFITIFSAGLGAVSDPPGTGRPASGDPLSTSIETPQVTIGGIPATVSFSGLSPSFVGLYQVNAQIPEGAVTGDAVPLALTIGGVESNTVTIAVSDGQSSSSNPVPTVTALSPSSIDLDSAGRTLTLLGTGFMQASTVTLNGVAKTATYLSETQLTIVVTLSDLVIDGDYPVVVTNPVPGGGSSSAFTLPVLLPPPDEPDDDDY